MHHTDNDLKNRVLALARAAIGTPYVDHADNLHAGCNCIGFVYALFRAAGAPNLPPLAQIRTQPPRYCAGGVIQPADVLIFRWPRTLYHVALAQNSTFMIHCCSKRGVCCEAISPWHHRYLGRALFEW